jgi:putative hydrolase of the HAD superfamily
MILVFDLDDTLYDELMYVRSGFRAVAAYIQSKFDYPEDKSYKIMIEEFNRYGRGKVFDRLLQQISRLNGSNIKLLINIYRKHSPNIMLYKDAEYVLKNFRNSPKYIVTDGNKIVQKIKVDKLDLNKYTNKIYITHNYGLDKAKPSTYCFKKIAAREKVTSDRIIYIGDNPFKDFINLKREGYRTLRILRGNYSCLHLSSEYEADSDIETLYELNKYVGA